MTRPGGLGFPVEAARPLGKGYQEIAQMVLSYAVEGKTAGNPTLAHSLDFVRRIPGLKELMVDLPCEPICLIEGYSTPGNAEALKQFIHELNGTVPQIEGVDLYDLPHLYEVLGFRLPGMKFHIADAAHLEALFPDRSIDLVVQDFLLNCIPASRHEPLLREAVRVLKPGGIGLISFTSSEALEQSSAMSTGELQARHGITWNVQAYDLAELGTANGSATLPAVLTNKLVYHEPTSEFIYISSLGGRFEFFRSKEEMFALFARCDLHLQAFDVSQGTDDHGLTCVRYRCLLARARPAA